MSSLINYYSPTQFVFVRYVLGAYLFCLISTWIPYATELFSNEGFITPDYAPYLLSAMVPMGLYYFSSSIVVQMILASMLVLSGLLFLGWKRRMVAGMLWLCWVWLLYLNPLATDPSHTYLALLLLTFAMVPDISTTNKSSWNVQPILYFGLWVILGVSFSISGVEKWSGELWQSGTAFYYFTTGYGHADSIFAHVVSASPLIYKPLTWIHLYSQILALPMVLYAPTRRIWWGVTTFLFLGGLFAIAVPPVFMGVLVFMFFMMDRWTFDVVQHTLSYVQKKSHTNLLKTDWCSVINTKKQRLHAAIFHKN